jgi:hypothetical protein
MSKKIILCQIMVALLGLAWVEGEVLRVEQASAAESPDGLSWGGAMISAVGELAVVNCRFLGNSGNAGGGAIRLGEI